MALYPVSSSGQLKISDTGLKTPVSFFTPEGIATGAIADGPLAGNNSRVYILDGQGNRFQSSGRLNALPGNFITGGNALASTSLGEIPLSGGDNYSVGTQVVKAFITSANQSRGNLVVSGSVRAIIAYQRTSSGQLKLSGSVTQQSKRLEISNTGQLRVSGSKVAPSIRNFTSSGQLKLTGSTVSRIILVASSSGQLVVTRAFAEGVNRTSSGQLRVSGSFTRGITLQPTSTGLLKVTTDWYTVNQIGGLSTEALAGAPIAAGSGPIQDIYHTTLIGSYGTVGKNSSGLIKFSPIGTPASDLSQDGALAGSALAGNSIAERRFNPDRTQFRQLLNIDSAGALKFDNSVKYRFDLPPGKLVLIGFSSGFNNDRKSSGSLVLTTSRTLQFVRNFLTSGNLTATPTGENPLALDSGIAGSSLASLPLGGGLDSLAGRTRFNSIRAELSSGNLVTTGVTGVGLKRLSSGQLVLTSTLATSSLRKESTAGQLKLSTTSLARSISIQHSSGQLVMAETDSYRTRWTEESRGQLRVTGSNVHQSLQLELSSGQLKLSSVVATRAIFATTSSGQELVKTTSQNPLSINNSGLAGSPLASISIAGGFDLPGNNTLFRSIRNEISTGQLLLNGYNVHRSLEIELSTGQLKLSSTLATSSLRNEATSGQLKLTATDYVTSRRNESSSGQLKLTGSVVTRSRRNESSSGNLKLYPVDAYRIIIIESGTDQLKLTGRTVSAITLVELSSGQELVATVSQNPLSINNSGLAGSPLASISIAGGFDLPGNNTLFRSIRNEISSGSLKFTSRTASSVKFDSAGNLKLSGSTVTKLLVIEHTAGNLVVNRTLATRAIIVEHSAGAFTLYNSDTFRAKIIEQSSGNLKLTGSTVSRLLSIEKTSGQLKLSSVVATRTILEPTSSGQQLVSTVSQNPLSINNSGLASSPLASISIAGGFDLPGNVTLFRSLRNEGTAGQLSLTGYNVHSSLEIEHTSGNLVLSTNRTTSSLRNERTSGNLIVNRTFTSRAIIVEHSSGSLTLTNSDAYRDKVIVNSAGNLTISGSTVFNKVKARTSSGRLSLTSTVATKIILVPTSSGQLIAIGRGENPLALDSSIASSPLASLPLGGGLDSLAGRTRFNSIRIETSTGLLYVTGSNVHSSLENEISSTGRLITTGQSVGVRTLGFNTSGRLVVTGTHAKNVVKSRTSSATLKLTPVGANDSPSVSAAIAGSTLADHPIAGAYELTTLSTVVSYISRGKFYYDVPYEGGTNSSTGDLVLRGTTSAHSILSRNTNGQLVLQGTTSAHNILVRNTNGQLVLSGTDTVSLAHIRTTSGQLLLSSSRSTGILINEPSTGRLVVSGTNIKQVGHVEVSSGQLRLTGATNKNVVHADITTGRLIVSGTTVNEFVYSETSSGQLNLSGNTVSAHLSVYSKVSSGNVVINGVTNFTIITGGRAIYSESSDGNIHITGTSITSNKVVKNVVSSGQLTITGSATASTNIVPPAPKVIETARGGSYVYATSWDILQPYFPDDRHILGYRELLTSGIGVIGVYGSSTVEFIPAPKVEKPKGKSLFDYIKETEKAKKATPITVNVPVPVVSKFKQQALQEDEMLLNGTLLDIDPLQDELDQELLY